MMGKLRNEYPAQPSINYVFVPNVDVIYARAIEHGATPLGEPADRTYGNREAGFSEVQKSMVDRTNFS